MGDHAHRRKDSGDERSKGRAALEYMSCPKKASHSFRHEIADYQPVRKDLKDSWQLNLLKYASTGRPRSFSTKQKGSRESKSSHRTNSSSSGSQHHERGAHHPGSRQSGGGFGHGLPPMNSGCDLNRRGGGPGQAAHTGLRPEGPETSHGGGGRFGAAPFPGPPRPMIGHAHTRGEVMCTGSRSSSSVGNVGSPVSMVGGRGSVAPGFNPAYDQGTGGSHHGDGDADFGDEGSAYE